MTPDDLDDPVLDAAVEAAEAPRESESLDQDNRLKPEFVRRVQEALEAGETDAW